MRCVACTGHRAIPQRFKITAFPTEVSGFKKHCKQLIYKDKLPLNWSNWWSCKRPVTRVRATVKHDTAVSPFPALMSNFLHNRDRPIDNLFADLWKQVGWKALLLRCGFHKRSGIEVSAVLYCLTMWVWLKSNSISLFARDSLRTFCAAGKDVLYEAMNREDWVWRALHLCVARKALQQLTVPGGTSAFVLDDTIRIRSGNKMPGVSSHFDHTTGHHVMGQQVLTLGLSCAQGFVPIDSELFTSKTKVVGLCEPFKDGRSIVAGLMNGAESGDWGASVGASVGDSAERKIRVSMEFASMVCQAILMPNATTSGGAMNMEIYEPLPKIPSVLFLFPTLRGAVDSVGFGDLGEHGAGV